nr:hypothetical protein [Endobacter medicaginis]
MAFETERQDGNSRLSTQRVAKRAMGGVALVALCALAACEVPSPEQRAKLNSMIGQDETTLVRTFGVPTRVYQTGVARFVAYEQRDTNYSPGTPGWGWGWGCGWGGGWG